MALFRKPAGESRLTISIKILEWRFIIQLQTNKTCFHGSYLKWNKEWIFSYQAAASISCLICMSSKLQGCRWWEVEGENNSRWWGITGTIRVRQESKGRWEEETSRWESSATRPAVCAYKHTDIQLYSNIRWMWGYDSCFNFLQATKIW